MYYRNASLAIAPIAVCHEARCTKTTTYISDRRFYLISSFTEPPFLDSCYAFWSPAVIVSRYLYSLWLHWKYCATTLFVEERCIRSSYERLHRHVSDQARYRKQLLPTFNSGAAWKHCYISQFLCNFTLIDSLRYALPGPAENGTGLLPGTYDRDLDYAVDIVQQIRSEQIFQHIRMLVFAQHTNYKLTILEWQSNALASTR